MPAIISKEIGPSRLRNRWPRKLNLSHDLCLPGVTNVKELIAALNDAITGRDDDSEESSVYTRACVKTRTADVATWNKNQTKLGPK